jgi:hypothetical protein
MRRADQSALSLSAVALLYAPQSQSAYLEPHDAYDGPKHGLLGDQTAVPDWSHQLSKPLIDWEEPNACYDDPRLCSMAQPQAYLSS